MKGKSVKEWTCFFLFACSSHQILRSGGSSWQQQCALVSSSTTHCVATQRHQFQLDKCVINVYQIFEWIWQSRIADVESGFFLNGQGKEIDCSEGWTFPPQLSPIVS